ncbi:S1C family serine protease, partial [Pradoshia sp.]|uniref:S1C family serine protease n=1 Tax=Pradoshia sp. TaxID=2651281 RepID=UPI003F0B04D5
MASYGFYLFNEKKQTEKPIQVKEEQVKVVVKEAKKETSKPAAQKLSTAPKDVSQIIEESLSKVFTISNGTSQGSGFLINKNGDILTNAHVVEGNTSAIVKDHNGTEHQGTIIGYSNDVDIALIRVPNLANHTPLSLETTDKSQLGDEIIALGSPRGLENSATLGNISGVDRTFVIEPHLYDGIYQISAPLAPGSSGGPLLDRKTEKVIAINSAKMNGEDNIGFSIPLYKIMNTVTQWSSAPMSEQEINQLFYNEAGAFYYEGFYGNEGYFDGGSYEEEYDSYYEDYEYDYDDSEFEEDYSEYDDYEYDHDEGYDDMYDDSDYYEEDLEEDESLLIEEDTEEAYDDTLVEESDLEEETDEDEI